MRCSKVTIDRAGTSLCNRIGQTLQDTIGPSKNSEWGVIQHGWQRFAGLPHVIKRHGTATQMIQ